MPFGYIRNYQHVYDLEADNSEVTTDISVTGDVAATGDVNSGGAVTATGAVSGATVTATGAVTGASLTTDNATIDAAGAITGTSLNVGSGNVIAGSGGFTGSVLATGLDSAGTIRAINSYMTAGAMLFPGQGLGDMTFNGFFSQDMTNGAGQSYADDGTLTPTTATVSILSGSATQNSSANNAFDGQFGNYLTFTSVSVGMTWRMTVDMGRTVPFFSNTNFNPYVLMRTAFGLTDYWNAISFETSPDNVTWYQHASWNATDVAASAKAPGLWSPGQAAADPTFFSWRYCRWTFTDHQVGTLNPGQSYISQMGVRHVNAPFWHHALYRFRLNHIGTTAGFFGVTPATRPTAYTVAGAAPTKSLNPSTATAQDVGNALAQVIADLQSLGLLS